MLKIFKSALIVLIAVGITALGTEVLASNGGWSAKERERAERFKDKFDRKMEQLNEKMEKRREKLEDRFDREMKKSDDFGFFDENERWHATSTATSTATSERHLLLQVGPRGSAHLRGFVTGSTGSSTLSVRSWGGVWQVGIASTTRVFSEHQTLADFATGDYVILKGQVSSTTPLTLTAKVIRDRTP